MAKKNNELIVFEKGIPFRTKTIFVDLMSSKGLLQGEKQKKRLENEGWNLTRQTNTFTQARFYYAKKRGR